MKFVTRQVPPFDYYDGVADEFETVAARLADQLGPGDPMVERLKELAEEIRESTTWHKAA